MRGVGRVLCATCICDLARLDIPSSLVYLQEGEERNRKSKPGILERAPYRVRAYNRISRPPPLCWSALPRRLLVPVCAIVPIECATTPAWHLTKHFEVKIRFSPWLSNIYSAP